MIDDDTRRLLDDLLASPDAPRDWKTPPAPAAAPSLPVIPIGFVHEGVVLHYFSLVTTVGTPQSAAAQELRMECMFPADDATEARHRHLLDTHAPAR
ncbi:transcriptional regulator [Burkholderia lata]|nr:transcriptional regulator [Burkholderia lata]